MLMPPRTTVLVISYYFAPSAAVGAKRFSFLCREFAAQGYDVRVVAADVDNPFHGAGDASLPMAGRVARCAETLRFPLRSNTLWARLFNKLVRPLLAPLGFEIFWVGRAVRAARALAADAPRGVVITTMPPPAALIAGARIARELGWPLLFDYRDPWSGYEWPTWRQGRFSQWLSRRVETHYLKQSSARILNTPAMRDWFERSFPAIPKARNFVIPNGFDPVTVMAQPPPANGVLEIVHAGVVYAGRSLLPALRAAAKVATRHPEREIRVITYGELPAAEISEIHAAGLQSFLEVRPRVPRTTVFAHLQRAHVLLAVVGDHMTYSTPYKVYDYMAAGRPILALAPEGAALHSLIVESGAGISVAPENEAGAEQALENLLFGAAPDAAHSHIERYRWSNLALQYRGVIEAVARSEASHVPHARRAGTPPRTG